MIKKGSPAILAVKGIVKYLESHPDDQDLDSSLIYNACKNAIEAVTGDDDPEISEDEVPTKMSEEFRSDICGLTHESLQTHQICPVCLADEDNR